MEFDRYDRDEQSAALSVFFFLGFSRSFVYYVIPARGLSSTSPTLNYDITRLNDPVITVDGDL